MPVDINRLTEGWLELESDPGLFTLLLEDFGVKGVQVEEIYDLQKSLDGPVYGFIFLFRWIEERRSRRKVVEQTETFVKDEEVVNSIFFAQQVVPNSCATHSLLSVLLNCPSIELGATLSRLKAHTSGMCPENKGWAIGNSPELAKAHNSHAMPQAKWCSDKSTGVSTGRYTGEAFHFVSYVPIQGRLFELDGLKPYPMDHGPWGEKEDWTEKFRRVITERLGIATGEQYHDIRFNLMAVVPDKRLAVVHKLKMLKTNRQIVLDALQQLVKLNNPEPCKGKEAGGKNAADADTGAGAGEGDPARRKTGEAPCEPPSAKAGGRVDEVSASGEAPHRYPAAVKLADTAGGEQPELSPTDYSTPLTIQMSPAPSGFSTDTSSEVGSAFNSPTQGCIWNSGQSSPTCTKDFEKFVVIKVAGSGDEKMESSCVGTFAADNVNGHGKRAASDSSGATKRICLENGGGGAAEGNPSADKEAEGTPKDTEEYQDAEEKKDESKVCSKYPELFEPHTFAPKDLFALLKNLENEITVCEMCLRDENEKRKKYKIDDSRRTHNYDEFICTFLSMLAEQGKLADLVQQHLLLQKRPGVPVARVQRPAKKQESKPSPSRRRRRRTNNRKRK